MVTPKTNLLALEALRVEEQPLSLEEIMEFADTNGEYLDPDLLAQVLKAYMRDGILQALSARTKSNDKIIKVKLTDIGKELAEKNRDAVTEILATRMTETD